MNKPILLVPLDERPVNTLYPSLLAEIGGAHILLPPVEIRGFQRDPANIAEVSQWLLAHAPGAAGAVVSADFLAFGNLINARITNDSAAKAIRKLEVLGERDERDAGSPNRGAPGASGVRNQRQ